MNNYRKLTRKQKITLEKCNFVNEIESKLLRERDLLKDEYREIQKITDLVVTMIADERIALKIREEYLKKIDDEKMLFVSFFSHDLIEIFKKVGKFKNK